MHDGLNVPIRFKHPNGSVVRRDARTPDGGAAASNPDYLVRDLLATHGIEGALLNCFDAGGLLSRQALSAEERTQHAQRIARDLDGIVTLTSSTIVSVYWPFAALDPKPLIVGVGHPLGALTTIYPQWHDIGIVAQFGTAAHVATQGDVPVIAGPEPPEARR